MDALRRPFLRTAILVFGLALLAHGRGLGGEFVYDDHRFVEQNPALASLDPAGYFRDPSTASASEGIQHDIYRPLRTLLFGLEWQVFGSAPTGWHVVSLLLHAIASILVLRILWPLVRGVAPAAGVGAAAFAVHPVGVECVAWISSQGDLLAMVLGLAALLVLERKGVLRTFIGFALVALACFAKESALVLPALLLLRDLALPKEVAPPRRTTALRVAGLAVVVGVYLALRLTVIPEMAQVNEFPGGSRVAAARGMLAALVWYAKALVWPFGFPFDLHLLVPLHASDPEVVLGAGLLLTLLVAGIWGLATRRGLLAFATLGALACLVPVSNVLVPLKAVVAERFLYPVLVCFAAGLAYAILSIPKSRRLWALAVVVVALGAGVLLSWQRTEAWDDDLVLWETVLRDRPTHARAYEGLGYEFLRRGRIRDAEIAYSSYLEYNPADGKAMRLVGDAFGEVARTLRMPGQTQREFATGTGRRQAREAQLVFYASALRTWNRIGLVRGRGSEAMLLGTYDRMMEAAWDLGDVLKVKEANDQLLRMEGVDSQDADAVFRDGSFHRRRMRLDLAWRVLTTPTPRDLRGEPYQLRMAQRATVLRDAGIPAGLPDAHAIERLAEKLRPLLEESRSDADRGVEGAGQIEVILTLRLVDLLGRLGRGPETRELVDEARRRHPSHPLLEGGR